MVKKAPAKPSPRPHAHKAEPGGPASGVKKPARAAAAAAATAQRQQQQQRASASPSPPRQPPDAAGTPFAAVPLALQQKILTVFSLAFGPVLASPSFPALLQDVKQALFNRDFAAAFGAEDRLEAYAARWSPTRALCYAAVLVGAEDALRAIAAPVPAAARPGAAAAAAPAAGQARLGVPGGGPPVDGEMGGGDGEPGRAAETPGGGAAAPGGGTDGTTTTSDEPATGPAPAPPARALKVLAVGGGPAELVALGALVAHAPDLRASVTLVDSGPWARAVQKLEAGLAAPLPLARHARSPAARDAAAPVLGPDPAARLRSAFLQRDALSLTREELAALAGGPAPALVTLLFTLNELFTCGGIGRTTSFLLGLSAAVAPGSLLLVVDSPGSYSEAAVGRESKRYPMQWLLDKVLLGGAGGAWTKVASDGSVWFRLPDALRYPIPLENMRYQVHLYRAT